MCCCIVEISCCRAIFRRISADRGAVLRALNFCALADEQCGKSAPFAFREDFFGRIFSRRGRRSGWDGTSAARSHCCFGIFCDIRSRNFLPCEDAHVVVVVVAVVAVVAVDVLFAVVRICSSLFAFVVVRSNVLFRLCTKPL